MDESKPNKAFFKKVCTVSFLYGQFLCWFTLVFTIWAFLNSDKDDVLEMSFFAFITLSAIFNMLRSIFKMGPIVLSNPKDLTRDEYGKLLEKVIHRSSSLMIGLIQPLFIGCLGIIAKELENNPNQIHFAIVAALIFTVAFIILSYRASWCRNEYIRVTGHAFIGF